MYQGIHLGVTLIPGLNLFPYLCCHVSFFSLGKKKQEAHSSKDPLPVKILMHNSNRAKGKG